MKTELYNAYQEKIIWTKEQESCLKYTGDKTLMVKGIAGAGKSLVIQALAKQLLAGCVKGKQNKVAIFTFSNTLNLATKEFLKINGEDDGLIMITTLSSYVSHVYRTIGAPFRKFFNGKLYDEVRKEAMREALEEHKRKYGPHRFHDLDLEFWLEEIEWMKDLNVSVDDEAYYLGLQRSGRGGKVRMNATDRKTAFEIYVNYSGVLQAKKLGEWADQCLYLVRNADKIPDNLKFDHILIDEAQDLSLVQMMTAMMFFRRDMVVAMDLNQRIFNKQWTPKLLGIEATTKKLTKSMRTTKQIDNLAESIRMKNDIGLEEDDKTIRTIPEQDGPIPTLVHLADMDTEKRFVIDQVKKYLAQNNNISIGIIAAQKKQVHRYAGWLTDAGIYSEIISKESTFSMAAPGVKIVNAYNAKGLEFTRVIIPQFVEGNFPYHHIIDDEEEMKLYLARCRNLVYVAMTRAKYSLLITYSGENGSRFIGEMDSKCYEAKGEEITFSSGGKTTSTRSVLPKKIDLPPTAPIRPAVPNEDGLKTFFEKKGFEVIDKRSNAGCLWVVGEKDKLAPHLKEAKELYGAFGNYAPNGGRATKNRPAWFTSCKK